MKRAWRIVKEKHAATAFDGEGARLYGGRWNSLGTPVVYTSATLSLAALENLVHLTPPVRFVFSAIPVDFDDTFVEVVDPAGLPSHWREKPPSSFTMEIGDLWVRESRSAVMKLPSALIPGESNFLLNPRHPEFKKIVIGPPEPFSFDPRLL